MKGTWESTVGGGGLRVVVLVIVAAALLGPAVVAAVAELLRVLLIVAGVIVGVGAASLAGLLAWRWRSRKDAARAMPPLPRKMARAAQPLPKAQPAHALPTGRQRELPGGLHLHFHGVSAEDVAAILRHQDQP